MWIKLDDGFATHSKILAAGIIAMGIQVRAICYASQNKTDGFIHLNAVPLLLTGLERIGIETARIGDSAASGCDADEVDWPNELVKAGLWEVRESGYYIHDYLHWNVSKKAYESLKKKLSNAGRKGMKSRWKASNQGYNLPYNSPNNESITSPSTSTATLSSLNSPDSEGEKIVKKRGNGAHPIPEEWTPKESHQKLASARHLDLPIEAAHFRGKAKELDWVQKDWDLKFTNFMLQEVKWQHQRRKP